MYTQYLVEEKKLPNQVGPVQAKTLSYSMEYAVSERVTDVTRLMDAHNKQLRLVHQRFQSVFLQNETISSRLTGLSRHPMIRSSAAAEYADIYYRLPDQDVYHNSAAVYPPLYYVIETIPYLTFYHTDILTRLMAMRVFSGILYLVALWIGFLLVRRVTKNFLLTMTVLLLAGSLPVFSHLAAGVNNEILLFLLTTLSLYWLVRLTEKITWPLTLLLGMTLGLGMLTKPQFIVCLPLAVIPFIYHAYCKKDITVRSTLGKLATCAVIVAVLTGWWYVWAYVEQNGFWITADGSAITNNRDVSIGLRTAMQYTFYRWLYAFSSFNFAFGFATEMIVPLWLFTLGSMFWILAATGLVVWIYRSWKRLTADKRMLTVMFVLSALFLEAFLYVLFIREVLSTGSGRFPIDGRYYVPVLFPLCLALVWGLTGWLKDTYRKYIYLTIIMYGVLLNFAALIGTVWPHFYL